jgi:predicted AlkP superfamily pyrophosphatase or phosphodiesterase
MRGVLGVPGGWPAASRRAAALFLALALAATWPGAASAAPPKHVPAAEPARPRLVVLLVIDMLPADLLSRVRDRLGADGFARLASGGARFTDCAYGHAITDTGPGHASIATGTTPDRHGIVGNQWYDRALGRMIGAVEDPEVPLVGAASPLPGASPAHLAGETLADELRLATGGRGHAVSVSEKARAAILLAGRAADGAYFYDQASGLMVTSSHYMRALPAWVAAFDDTRPADKYYSRGFTAGGKTVLAPGRPGTTPDKDYYGHLPESPWIDEILFDFARAAIAGERLGADDDTDLLAISLSAHDYVGHAEGPHSEAVAALTAAVDAGLAAFLRLLDERVGAGRWWLALTSDHGCAPTLATSRDAGLGDHGYDGPALKATMSRALAARFGGDDPVRLLGETTHIWFDTADLARHQTTAAEAARVAGEAATGTPGIVGWFAAGGGSSLDAATLEAFRRSTYPGRSADLCLLRAPFALDTKLVAADHGTPWSYDARVPLILYGAPFRPGIYRQHASPIDIAPTLANALGIAPPALATGRVLAEAFR